MNYLTKSLLIFFLALPLFAQQNLSLETRRQGESSGEWELSVYLTVSPQTVGGFYLQLPAGIRVIPTQIESDGRPMWLLNSDQPPSQDSVVCWYERDGGLLILLPEDEVPNGSSLVIEGMLVLFRDQVLPQELFSVQTISYNGGRIDPTQQVVESAGLPVPLTR